MDSYLNRDKKFSQNPSNYCKSADAEVLMPSCLDDFI